MAKAKDIQRRIRAIGSTRKITRAMEMVAATKMRKAVEGVLRTRTYANLGWTTVIGLSKAANIGALGHPLLKKRERVRRVGIVLLTSNRGLCGGYNDAIVRKAQESIVKHSKNEQGEPIEHEMILVGKKGYAMHSYFHHPVAAEFPKSDIAAGVAEVLPVARLVIDEFAKGHYDKVMVAYTDFVGTMQQVPRVKQLLPVDVKAERDHYLGIVGADSRVGLDRSFVQGKEDKYLKEEKGTYVFTFEPDGGTVLDAMLPRLIEVQLFQALLESNASEHSARMAAMSKANKAAGDLVDSLTLYFNKARQTAITAELAEIVSGAQAMRGRRR